MSQKAAREYWFPQFTLSSTPSSMCKVPPPSLLEVFCLQIVRIPTRNWSFNGTMSAQKTNSTVADREVQCDAPEDPDHISHLHLESMAPNQFDAKYEASKYEFWAYCGWYTGNSGLLFYQFATIAFQSLLTQAAGTAGILRFAGR